MTAQTADRTSFYSTEFHSTGWSSVPLTDLPVARQPRRSPAADAVAQAMYALMSFPLALLFFIGGWVLCSVGLGLAVIWVGVPVLALGLLFARFGAFLQLGLYESMLGRPTGYDGPRARRRGRGTLGALALVITDAGSWRALGYWLFKMILAPVQFGMVIGLYAYSLGTLSYPYWRQWLPAQQASDGSWHRGSSFGTDFFVDTWPRMLVQAGVGIVVLILAPAIVRAVNAIDRALLIGLVAGRSRQHGR
jgi:hypothetical protein